jgi:hypothetical protein
MGWLSFQLRGLGVQRATGREVWGLLGTQVPGGRTCTTPSRPRAPHSRFPGRSSSPTCPAGTGASSPPPPRPSPQPARGPLHRGCGARALWPTAGNLEGRKARAQGGGRSHAPPLQDWSVLSDGPRPVLDRSRPEPASLPGRGCRLRPVPGGLWRGPWSALTGREPVTWAERAGPCRAWCRRLAQVAGAFVLLAQRLWATRELLQRAPLQTRGPCAGGSKWVAGEGPDLGCRSWNVRAEGGGRSLVPAFWLGWCFS